MSNVTRTERRRIVRSRRAPQARGSVALRCTATELCDFHRDGGAEHEPCPGTCDAENCRAPAFYEIGTERMMCAAHAGIVLLARAIREALAADGDDPKAGR